MPFSQFIFIPLFIAFQAFVLMLIAPFVPGNPLEIGGKGLLTWIAFQAWAVYFFAGFAPWNDKENGPCPFMGFKSFLGYVGGIVCSLAIFELNKLLGGLNGSTAWGLYIAVFIVVVAVICFERVPYFNFIPAWFVGAGVYFALMTFAVRPEGTGDYAWYGYLAMGELAACVVGLVFGYVTVKFRGTYEAKLAEKNEGK